MWRKERAQFFIKPCSNSNEEMKFKLCDEIMNFREAQMERTIRRDGIKSTKKQSFLMPKLGQDMK